MTYVCVSVRMSHALPYCPRTRTCAAPWMHRNCFPWPIPSAGAVFSSSATRRTFGVYYISESDSEMSPHGSQGSARSSFFGAGYALRALQSATHIACAPARVRST